MVHVVKILWLHMGCHFTTIVNATALVSKDNRRRWRKGKNAVGSAEVRCEPPEDTEGSILGVVKE